MTERFRGARDGISKNRKCVDLYAKWAQTPAEYERAHLSTNGTNSTDNLGKNTLPYPTELGSPSFGELAVGSEKELAYRFAVDRGRRELDRLKSIADLIAAQAMETKQQVDAAEAVSRADCNFSPKPGREYWLAEIHGEDRTILCHLGPGDWSAGPPDRYRYLGKVRQLPTGLWERTDP